MILPGMTTPAAALCWGRAPMARKHLLPIGSWAAAPTAATACLSRSRAASARWPLTRAKLEDPHLIIYNAVLTLRETTVVTNGDQTDTIAQFMNGNLFPGYSFEAALATRTYEDDAPNFTPRISGVVDMRRGCYKLSIVKSNEGNAASVQRQTFDYPQPVAGEGHFISTYVKNGAPIPSFAGEPLRVAIDTNDADQFAKQLWASLNDDNKVSLFVRSIALETGSYEDIILNKYTAVEG